MLTIDLGLASERIDADPAAAKQLILEGQEQARQALAEIRDLVRGIAPSILLDRGLVPALGSIVGPRARSRRSIRSDLAARRAPAGGRGAGRLLRRRRRRSRTSPSTAAPRAARCAAAGRARRLIVEVWDDGAGGATVEPGGGLAGLAGRVAGVDGTFTVSSPAGGPTLVRAGFPVVGRAAATSGGSCRALGAQVRRAPPARGGGRSASRAGRACRRCC